MIDKHLLESSPEILLTGEDRQRIEKLMTKQTKGYKALKSAIEERVDELMDESIKGGPGSGRYPKGSGRSLENQVALDWLIEKMTSSKPLGNVRQITDDDLTEYTSKETAGVIKQVVREAMIHLASLGWRAGFAKSEKENTNTDGEHIKEILNGLLVKYVTEQNKSLKGGQGSGNFGHAGRPGMLGGSGEGGAQNEFEKIQASHTQGDTKSQFYHNGKWDENRVKNVHEPILKKLTENIPKAQDGKPVLYMTGGGSASGKTQLLNEEFGFPKSSNVVSVDPDKMKLSIPEYNNLISERDKGAASYVHEESSSLSKLAVKESLANGYDVTYDSTGDSSPEIMADKIASFRNSGATQVIGNYAFPGSIEEAQSRADQRGERAGRYVDPALLAANHAEVSRTWNELAQRGSFDKLNLWNTAGPREQKPTLIASAEKGKINVVDASMFDKFKKIGGR